MEIFRYTGITVMLFAVLVLILGGIGVYFGYPCYNFNRLVDVEQIASVSVVHRYPEAGQETAAEMTRVYEP